jgi:hypothetical protein
MIAVVNHVIVAAHVLPLTATITVTIVEQSLIDCYYL